MKFYAKVPKNAHHISYAPSESDEYQEYLERGFVFDKLPSYRPKRITLFQALSSVAGLKASWNSGYISPVVHNNVAYATNGAVIAVGETRKTAVAGIREAFDTLPKWTKMRKSAKNTRTG